MPRALDFGLPGFRITQAYISLVSKPLVCGVWPGHRRRLTHSLLHDPASSVPPTSSVSPSRRQPKLDPPSSPVPSGLCHRNPPGAPEMGSLCLCLHCRPPCPPHVCTPSSMAASVSFCECTSALSPLPENQVPIPPRSARTLPFSLFSGTFPHLGHHASAMAISVSSLF